jgi:hypothetical protein
VSGGMSICSAQSRITYGVHKPVNIAIKYVVPPSHHTDNRPDFFWLIAEHTDVHDWVRVDFYSNTHDTILYTRVVSDSAARADVTTTHKQTAKGIQAGAEKTELAAGAGPAHPN